MRTKRGCTLPSRSTVSHHMACLTEEKCRKLLALAGTAEGSFSGSLHRDGTLYFAVENNKGLFKGSGSDDVLREKFTRQLKWCTDVMDAFAP